jgi:hypothetical protein
MGVVISFPTGKRPGELTPIEAASALGVDLWMVGLALASGTLKSRRVPGYGEFIVFADAYRALRGKMPGGAA